MNVVLMFEENMLYNVYVMTNDLITVIPRESLNIFYVLTSGFRSVIMMSGKKIIYLGISNTLNPLILCKFANRGVNV